MADYQSLLNAPEYATVIDNLTKKYALQKAQADAQAKGEAQRRGLVNQTGTSDIEMSLRGNKVGAVADAEATSISNVLNQAAQAGNANQQAALQRDWGTSERLGTQGWQTGENTANRTWQTGERTGAQEWNAGQNTADKTWQEAMMNKQRQWNLDDQPSGTQSFLSGISGGVGQLIGNLGGNAISKIGKKLFSDIRLKENIKKIGTINIYEYNYIKNSGIALPTGKCIGVMAQELEKIAPELVGEDRGYKYIDYSKMTGV